VPTIKLLKRAENELLEACKWYEDQQAGLLLRFRQEIKTSLNSINLNPKLYPQRYQSDLRFKPLQIFPYILVYWFDEQLNTVFIISVFHTKRKPEEFK
jgi:plasmid stabilization system protein ParE